ncbi:MAG: hypothetical protein AAF430_06195 [Myxococcota bacterium]
MRLLMPRTQLILTGAVLCLSLGFAGAFAWHAHSAYAGFYKMLASTAPESFLLQLSEQASDFVWVSGAILIAYVAVMVSFCVAWSHRMLGPIVPIRRMIEALKNGDTDARIKLRSHDGAFQPMADDLNELGAMLDREKLGR